MTQIHWAQPVSGAFLDGAAWNGGTAPGPADDAFLDAAGGAFTVTSSGRTSVEGIDLSTNATLDIARRTRFTAANGTDGGVNAGVISIGDGATFGVGGEIDNTGTIVVGGGRLKTTLLVEGAGVTLDGGGTVELSDNTQYSLLSGVSGSTVLTNIDNTIAGSGDIYVSLDNRAGGTVDANKPSGMNIETFPGVTNAGLIEATDGSSVYLDDVAEGGSIEGKGGKIFAAAGSSVTILGTRLDGGALQTAAGGRIFIGNGSSAIVRGPFRNAGTLFVDVGAHVRVEGMVTGPGSVMINRGTLNVESNFTQNVTFYNLEGHRGRLVLSHSQDYTGQVSGFGHGGGTSLDLEDIGFVGSSEATFAGTAASGVLTVTDGTHAAHITLIGDYAGTTFVASSDGRGGTIVKGAGGGAVTAPPSACRFASSMAGLTSHGDALAATGASTVHPHPDGLAALRLAHA